MYRGVQTMNLKTLKEARKVIGLKQVTKAVKRHSAEKVLLAGDADERVMEPLRELCREEGIEVLETESMKALGMACGIEVGAAAAAVLK